MSFLFSFKHRRADVLFQHIRNITKYEQCGYIAKASIDDISHKSAEKYLTFNNMIKKRRDESANSLLVQVQSPQSFRDLHAYCSAFGEIKNLLHYSSGIDPMHFIIIEFTEMSQIQQVLKNATFLDDTQVVPAQSAFLWFRFSNKKLTKLKYAKDVKLIVENGNASLSDSSLNSLLKSSADESQQMIKLYKSIRLNDIGTRLRFLVTQQIENSLYGMFPNARAFPFGSTVNGYGKMGCDLDLVLRLNSNQTDADSRLVYHSKAGNSSERSISQRQMEVIGDLIQLFLPGCTHVRRILQARVPIIKYYHQLADVECDLSMSNLSGIYMSDFLYMMGSIDDRVRPLVFTIRKWAAAVFLTNSSPGRWITNFSLTLMVLYFLQIKNILPPLKNLIKMAEPSDKYMTEDGINCTFLRDVSKYLLLHPNKNSDRLKTLLYDFYAYYVQFDFSTKAICLVEGQVKTKPDNSALYIINPLERGLNVSKNVSLEELERFKMEARNAIWLLESNTSRKTDSWGILQLFEMKKSNYVSNKPPKLLEVSKLFDDNVFEDRKDDDLKNDELQINDNTKQSVR